MKKISKRISILLACILCISLVFTACSSNDEKPNDDVVKEEDSKDKDVDTEEDADAEEEQNSEGEDKAKGEKVELEFWTFWGSETRRPIIEKIVDDFNESQEEIEVKHVFLPWGDIWTKNLAAIAAGNPTDVIVNDINSVAVRAQENQNMDLTPYIEEDDENIEERFFENLWETTLYEGKPYALPFNTDTRLLFYNKDHFEEVGLDPEKPPQTWDELEEYAKKLDKKNGDKYDRIGFYPLWGNFGATVWLLNADNGVSWLDEDWNPVINTPNKVEALEWLNSWTDRLGRKTVDAFKAEFGDQQANPFISGKVSMFVDVATFYTQIRDYGQDMNYGVAFAPEREEGAGHWSWGGGFVVEIPKGAKHPEESYEFMKYLTDVDAQKYWAMKNFDNIANKEASNDPELQKIDVYKLAVENMEQTVMTPLPVFAPDYTQLVDPLIDEALLGNKDPQAALDEAQKDVEELFEDKK